MKMLKKINHVVLGLVAVLTTGGCALGPDFPRVQEPLAKAFVPGTPVAETVSADGAGGAAQRVVVKPDGIPDWWTLFRCAALDKLVKEALDGSPTLEQARARLVQAREAFNAQSGATTYPAVDLGLSAKRQQVDAASQGLKGIDDPSPFNLYNASVSVSYRLDMFGRNRRILEGLGADVDRRTFEWEAARETVAANVVVAVIQQAALQMRYNGISNLLSVQEGKLRIVEAQYRSGGVSALELENQRLQVSQTRAALPPLEIQISRLNNQLAVYLGKPPAEASLPTFDLDDLHLPEEIPISLPAELARRRPDIRAAEALWHKASAGIGVATADLYPQVTLSGSVGSQETSGSSILNSLNIWSLGGGLMQPVFRGGELRSKKREAVAVYDEAAALYRQTVLQGFQEVADALQALDADARLLQTQSESVLHARTAYEIASRQFDNGAISKLALLSAQGQLMQAEIDRITAQANRYADTAALFHSLGGSEWQGAGKK